VRYRSFAGLAILLVTPIVEADEPTKPTAALAGQAVPGDKAEGAGRSIARRFAEIRSEYDAQEKALRLALEKAKDRRERDEISGKLAPVVAVYSRRLVDLALSSPADPAARDALLWVIGRPGVLGEGASGDEFARAASLLVRHHGDDPEAVRFGLDLSNVLNSHRDELLLGFYASAKGREAKGLARLALARYLEKKALAAASFRKGQGERGKTIYHNVIGDDGKRYDKIEEMSDERYAYKLHLRQCDPDFLKAEAERLYEEVMSEYGDVPLITRREREIEALLREPNPVVDGKPLPDENRRRMEKRISARTTLGQSAEAGLDSMLNLAVGKPAPDIDGLDLDGKPLKLSDFRGKVVVLVFWGSWCGPCMAEVPHERELVERLKGRPFALLGVDCNEERSAALKAVKAERMTWPSWHDGAESGGPIATKYHIKGFPSVFVLDAKGIIRARDRGQLLDRVVDSLLGESAPPTPE
jgi:thiol-disulfide isomerase/thioredoxin